MARASFSGTYGHNLQLEIVSGGSRQDIANNFSMVNVQVRLIANSYPVIYGAGSKTLKVSAGGESKTISVDANISQNQNKLIFDKEFKVPYDSNGSKSVYISARLDINQGGYDWAEIGVDVQFLEPVQAHPPTG